MTNAERFRNPDERYVEFKKFCHKYTCGNCPVNEDGIMEAKCGFKWLDLEYKEELKNCPFCDGTAILYAAGNPFIRCDDCGTQTAVYQTPEEAIAAWNGRCNGRNTEIP